MRFWAAWLVAEITVSRGEAWRLVARGCWAISDALDRVSHGLTMGAAKATRRAMRLAVAARRRLEGLRP